MAAGRSQAFGEEELGLHQERLKDIDDGVRESFANVGDGDRGVQGSYEDPSTPSTAAAAVPTPEDAIAPEPTDARADRAKEDRAVKGPKEDRSK